MTHIVDRYHDISTGHRVVGHEGKCRHLHGHNYRVHFRCEVLTPEPISNEVGGIVQKGRRELDEVGRVIDFGVVKEKLCMWLEDNWDHKFLAWNEDTVMRGIYELLKQEQEEGAHDEADEAELIMRESIVWLHFNPTAENMAEYLVSVVGPERLHGTGVTLTNVRIEETRKCSVEFKL